MATTIVKSGQTLSGIAAEQKTTIKELQKLNPQITDPNKIFIGQKLTLPSVAGPRIMTGFGAKILISPALSLPPISTGQELLTKAGVTAPLGSPEATKQILAKSKALITPTIKKIDKVDKGDDITVGGEIGPDLPSGDSEAISSGYLAGITQDLENKSKALTDLYDKQLKDLEEKKSALETKLSDLETKQEVMLETDVKPLLEPFREDLEKTERQRLKVEENFFANQASVKELETILNQALSDIQAAETIPGLGAIKNPRIAKVREDAAARAGIIEAVMAVRDGQIMVAENMIDRSIGVIEADRKDQLTYYQAVLDFYESKKDDAGNKLITLEKDEKDFVEKKINLLKSDLETAQASVNYIKSLMLDPTTADIVEQAGVKLTDSIEEIQKKFANYGYTQEVNNIRNTQADEGFEHIADESLLRGKPEGGTIVRKTDSRGNEHIFWKKAEVKEVTPPSSFQEWTLAGGLAGTGKTFAEWLEKKKVGEGTAAQFKVAGFATRMVEANTIFDEIADDVIPLLTGIITLERLKPEGFKKEIVKRQEQAERNFINAVLRRESGAAIAPSEFESAALQYFPQPGDTKTVLDQKKANRKTVTQSLIDEAGPAYTGIVEGIDEEFNIETDDTFNIFSDIPIEMGGSSTDPISILE